MFVCVCSLEGFMRYIFYFIGFILLVLKFLFIYVHEYLFVFVSIRLWLVYVRKQFKNMFVF